MSTSTLELELVNGVKSFFGKSLNNVTTLGGAWNEETVNIIIKTAPAIYIAYIGSRRARQPSCVIGSWALFISAKTLNAQQDRASAYSIRDGLIGYLHHRKLPSAAGAFEYTQDANLYTATQARKGIVVYGVYFDVLQHLPPQAVGGSGNGSINDFETYHHRFNTDPILESINKLPIQE